MSAELNHITNAEHGCFTMIPNLVDDLGLTVYAFRLYCHIRRVTGDFGACWQSTTTLAKHCNMSHGSVIKSKRELARFGLIHIEKKKGGHGDYDEIEKKRGGHFDYDEIIIADIWARNMAFYAKE